MYRNPRILISLFSSVLLFPAAIRAEDKGQDKVVKPRARDLGVPFDGTPGPLNAITDVPGVTVGHTTLISGEGKLQVGKGPVRTGVTAVLPLGQDSINYPVLGGWFSPTGNWWSHPGVAEPWDGWLNDINGFHVKPEHAFHAIDSAKSGPVEEGNVGGGTGMICNEFKGGIGTSSRKIESKAGSFTVGVLVQCNYGTRPNLRIAGVPVGKEIPEDRAYSSTSFADADRGSIIVVVATDVPLVAHQPNRLARRVSLGLGRDGSISGNGSGDIFIAFSTANSGAAATDHIVDLKMSPNALLEA